MKKSLPKERVDLSLWAKETCDGLMFLGTSVMKEEECLSKIKKGIELCDFIEKLDLVSADKEIPSIDVDTFITLKRVASNKSLLDYKSFKEIKGKTKEMKGGRIFGPVPKELKPGFDSSQTPARRHQTGNCNRMSPNQKPRGKPSGDC